MADKVTASGFNEHTLLAVVSEVGTVAVAVVEGTGVTEGVPPEDNTGMVATSGCGALAAVGGNMTDEEPGSVAVAEVSSEWSGPGEA